MKAFFCLTFLLLACHLKAQRLEWGLVSVFNIATHTNFNPQVPEDGNTQWGNLYLPGIGMYAQHTFRKKWVVEANLTFQQRGFKEIAQVAFLGTGLPGYEGQYENTFQVITLGLNGGYQWFAQKKVPLSLKGGVELAKKVNSNVQSNVFPLNEVYPNVYYGSSWKSFFINYQLGIGIKIASRLEMELYWNRSLVPKLKEPDLEVKDFIWSIRLKYQFNKLSSN